MREVIRHFHLFCGIGGGAAGGRHLDVSVQGLSGRFECLGGIDVDKGAVEAFSRYTGSRGTCLDLFSAEQFAAFHGRAPKHPWREATPQDLRDAAGGQAPDVLVTSPPCLPANGKVISDTGPVSICEIRPGRRVLTHLGRYRSVAEVGKEIYRGTMTGVRLNGSVDMQWFTAEHPLWVRRVVRNKASAKRRSLGEASFVAAQGVEVGDRIGFPVDRERPGTAQAFIGADGDPRIAARGDGEVRVPRVVDLRSSFDSADLWFILGYYLGDGYRRRDRYEVCFCVGPEGGRKFLAVSERLSRLGFAWSVDRSASATNVKIRLSAKSLHTLCARFGDGASEKRIPEQLFGLERSLVDQLILGYRTADGSENGRRQPPGSNELQARWRVASTSLQLLRDLQRLLLRQGVFGGINECWPGGPQVIEGRSVNSLPRWEIVVRLDPVKRTTFQFEDGAVWVRVRQLERRETAEEVWNLEVEEDNTFCAPLMATHNCKGFSGLVSESRAASDKYLALNALALRGIDLALRAWADNPPSFWLLENVPRLVNRGAALLGQIVQMLEGAGYAVSYTIPDLGELGGLAQSRKRLHLVARHREKCPVYVFEPPTRPLRAIGEVLGKLPLPGDPLAGPLHELPRLEWRTWVRLALIRAGGDWRDLKSLTIVNGHLRDLALVPEVSWHPGVLGVTPWNSASSTVTGRGGATNGAHAVADPRVEGEWHRGGLGVVEWEKPAGTITSEGRPTNGRMAIADPRPPYTGEYGQLAIQRWDKPGATVTASSDPGGGPRSIADPRFPWDRQEGDAYANGRHYGVQGWDETSAAVTASGKHDNGPWNIADPRVDLGQSPHGNVYRVQEWGAEGATVTGARSPGSGAGVIADPRVEGTKHNNVFRVVRWVDTSVAVTAGQTPTAGGIAVQDPRLHWHEGASSSKLRVSPWEEPARCVTGSDRVGSGAPSVADPRAPKEAPALALPLANDRGVWIIRALDGTWHRPMSVLERAALQGLVDVDSIDTFSAAVAGATVSRVSEWVGNAIPPPAMAESLRAAGVAILLSRAGHSFALSAMPVWVQPFARGVIIGGAA